VEEGGEFGEAEGEAFGGGGAEGEGLRGFGEVADQIEHGDVLDTTAVRV
jgi:hypothetical protein